MRRRRIAALFAAAVLVLVPGLNAAGEEELIPRRIRIDADEGVPTLVPAVLYARLASRIPLIVSDDPEELHNTVSIALDEELTVTLENRTGPVDSKRFPAELLDDPEALSGAFEALAAEWREYLGLTEPDVDEELVVQRETMAEEIARETDLITKFQATLWMPVSARAFTYSDNDKSGAVWTWLWPLRADVTWFFKENIGLTGSFRFEYGNDISFGSFNDNPVESTNLILMPGVGILIRTVGEFSAEFGITMFVGTVRMTAEADMDDPNLAAGDSLWIIYPVLSFEPALVWSPNAHWSVKAKLIGFNMNLAGMDDESINYSSERNTLVVNYLQLGAAYRW